LIRPTRIESPQRLHPGIDGSAYLFCMSSSQANGCDYSDPSYIVYQEIGGTSASSPAMAGIMSLVMQKMGSSQGLANPVFYALAAQENLTPCTSFSVSGSTCVFYDITVGNNAQVCVTGSPACQTSTSGDQLGMLSGYSAGTGYDLATGLGSVNATDLANAWSAAVGAQAVTLSPTSLTFISPAVGTASAAQTVSVKNAGSKAHPVAILAAVFVGNSPKSFSDTTTCPVPPATLAAGSICTVSVSFKPAAAGSLSATLNVADNATGSPQLGGEILVTVSRHLDAQGPASPPTRSWMRPSSMRRRRPGTARESATRRYMRPRRVT
jgi:subtilase family serine protease